MALSASTRSQYRVEEGKADLYAGARVGWVDAQVRKTERQQGAEHDAGHHDREQRAAYGDGRQGVVAG